MPESTSVKISFVFPPKSIQQPSIGLFYYYNPEYETVRVFSSGDNRGTWPDVAKIYSITSLNRS
jgi:hypothetical protein